ncbi:hypothetical protein [Cecembia rubra]|uniref:Uncharacterized protein n=1 Tax=Cecembia rubra TaxID=1485585 RepID=A0A2P8DYM8_9BACT|nr:hypothetical protein [Cecembia rubra]PSL02328.1 hypothetical protein CLV48_110111 [Cecembia rubra]
MKRYKFLLATLFIIFHYSCSNQDRKSVEIINKSIAFHGGTENWENIQSISMVRDIWMFEENGDAESYVRQENEFRLKPYFEAKMSWEKDSIQHRVIFDGIKTQYWMGSNEIQNQGFLQAKKREMDAAFYVMTKPFDLLDDKKYLSYEGKSELSGGVVVESIKVIDGDPKDPNTDIWWYFFDPNTFELVAYKVKTSDHFSLVYNLGWDKSSGVLLPARRESYRVDSLGNHLYKRASYGYGLYKVYR